MARVVGNDAVTNVAAFADEFEKHEESSGHDLGGPLQGVTCPAAVASGAHTYKRAPRHWGETHNLNSSFSTKNRCLVRQSQLFETMDFFFYLAKQAKL